MTAPVCTFNILSHAVWWSFVTFSRTVQLHQMSPKSWRHRQFEAEQKLRAQKATPVPQALTDDDNLDAASTKDGVLHEESFHESKEGPAHNGEHDVEAVAAAPDTQGLLSTLKIVNWWQASSLPYMSSERRYHVKSRSISY